MQNTINSNQNIRDCSLKQHKLKKFSHLEHGMRQTQQYSSRYKDSIGKDQTIEKRQVSSATAVRKGNSKTNFFQKKSNRNIQIFSHKSTSNENNEAPISQQIDLRQRQQEVKWKKSDIELPQATKNNNETKVKKCFPFLYYK